MQAWWAIAPSLLALVSGALLVTGVVATVVLYEELGSGIGPSLERRLQRELHAVVREAAARLDGGLVRAAVEGHDPAAPAYAHQRAVLRSIQERFELESDIYTLHLEGDGTVFGLTCKEAPLLGERYALRPEMTPVFQGAAIGHTGVYQDRHGWWISAYAPIRHGADVVGIVEADLSIVPYIEEARARVTRTVVVALLLGLLVTLPGVLLVSRWLARLGATAREPMVVSGFARVVLVRAVKVAVVVGTALNLINQGEALLAGASHVDEKLALLNFLVPFLVSSYSGFIAARDDS